MTPSHGTRQDITLLERLLRHLLDLQGLVASWHALQDQAYSHSLDQAPWVWRASSGQVAAQYNRCICQACLSTLNTRVLNDVSLETSFTAKLGCHLRKPE